ncbi:DUF962 domain-containing protein [Glaciimonas sp. GS1]|uniref:DUF962 domain-containing protein n=2 Tax=Glaciimonas soli TaxID=2590999 RepID=A0A843YS59_9BURK|nr:Mpo1-like protein [Glaciimonas soli]MQQ99535.1 DUF962 domain-containing protein [Glaciimonas soli]
MDVATREIDVLLNTYAESHRNPTNELIHVICIPAIIFAALGMFWSLHPFIAALVVVAALIYYCTLSWRLASGMLLMLALMLLVLEVIPSHSVFYLSLTVFVLAWIGQFVGHHIEGKKPSFFDDLRFLMIGPLFVLQIFYRRLHLAY